MSGRRPCSLADLSDTGPRRHEAAVTALAARSWLATAGGPAPFGPAPRERVRGWSVQRGPAFTTEVTHAAKGPRYRSRARVDSLRRLPPRSRSPWLPPPRSHGPPRHTQRRGPPRLDVVPRWGQPQPQTDDIAGAPPVWREGGAMRPHAVRVRLRGVSMRRDVLHALASLYLHENREFT
jgi:hypothetical protein